MKTIAAALLFLAVATAALAEPYKVGDTFDSFSTKDQHDRDYTFAPGVRRVVVSFTMGTGKDTNAWLAKQPASFLDDQHAIFLANIHGMPGIARKFALPKMRKYPHRILLADGEHFLDRYPREDGKLTVLRLDESGRVTAIEHVDPDQDPAPAFR